VNSTGCEGFPSIITGFRDVGVEGERDMCSEAVHRVWR